MATQPILFTDEFSVVIQVNNVFISRIYPWLKDNIGPQGVKWEIEWLHNKDVVGDEATLMFTNKDHLLLYHLRWSSSNE